MRLAAHPGQMRDDKSPAIFKAHTSQGIDCLMQSHARISAGQRQG